VVAPRSLIFNWMEEAERFTPSLRVGDFSGADRDLSAKSFAGYDLALVTYGTLRRDVVSLKEIPFDYVVLDEAQIIKNASTIAAKSARLLDGKHRLALSGTSVENRLSDLWSIVEFLNPGMLGATQIFSAIASDPAVDDPALELLRRALKPFILRRTKSQVAAELPARTEELIICEMKGAQKKEYDWLKRYYQANLLGKIEKNGINRSKILILEALLRLRQAACHPGLIDGEKREVTSVKLDTLLAQIIELRNEGHKCIVFSQFTKMLAIVRGNLDKADIPFEYLDGKTVDRKSKVNRFQSDPDCSVFLISLKAGGLGLNLTAAEYVFILDPWWNPAAEAQAIDRTHRIGQTKPVFAYKLICKNTVEEKVLELQRRKRHLADSIISSDESLLKGITVEDLKLLLA
jgi:SNF2 family DNA or RNA helicase